MHDGLYSVCMSDDMDRPGEREYHEANEARIATTKESIRTVILVGVVLLGLLGAPVLLAAWTQ